MRKSLLCVLSFCFVIALSGGAPLKASANAQFSKQGEQAGLNLDIARKYYSVATIESFINEIAGSSNPFLQLHMTDDQAVGVEMTAIGQTAQSAIYNGNQAVNPQTNLPFLTKADLKTLVKYAMIKKVTIIPEVDTPAHMEAILAQLQNYNPTEYQAIALPTTDDRAWRMMDPTKVASLQFAEQLINEYLPIFAVQQTKIFHLGMDETVDLPQSAHPSLMAYANNLAQFLENNGFTPRMWNDDIGVDDLSTLDHRIQICYWTPNNELNYYSTDAVATAGFQNTASAQALLDQGFQLLNYNGYYLYLVPSENVLLPANLTYSVNDLLAHWQLSNFSLNSGISVSSTQNVVGSAISIWGENAVDYTGEQIQQQTIPFVNAYLQKVVLGN